jgi:TolB-like protein/DNA-binding winged helix-turn-helix (wHTH) protein
MTETPGSSPQVVRFGVFAVDLQAGELYKGGVKLKLQDQPFQILSLLLKQPGKVVTREEIQQTLWPDGTFVDFEHSLNAAVKRLREALGDSAETPRFVETLPRRGYRFIYPVERGRRISRMRMAAIALAALAAVLFGLNVGGLRDRLLGRPLPGEITSIAVLPLENLSGDPEQEYFADGMTEALQFKGGDKPLQEIARQLKVDAVVEGAVVREGNRVRITAQLVEVSPERHLWSEQYERNLQSILTLQGEVARAIAREIKVTVTPAEETRLASARPVNREAHEAYLKGRFFLNKRTEEGLGKSIEYFQQAIEKDPLYARAYAGLADAYWMQPFYGSVPRNEAYPRTEAAAKKALELDDTLAEAHSSMGAIKSVYDWDWSAAEREYKRALELNPGYAEAHRTYARYLSNVGQLDEAIAEVTRARELDPLSLMVNTDVGVAFYFARQYDQAIEQLQKTLEIDPTFLRAYLYLVAAYCQKSMFEEAMAAAQKTGPYVSLTVALVHAMAGRDEERRKLAAEQLEKEWGARAPR